MGIIQITITITSTSIVVKYNVKCWPAFTISVDTTHSVVQMKSTHNEIKIL